MNIMTDKTTKNNSKPKFKKIIIQLFFKKITPLSLFTQPHFSQNYNFAYQEAIFLQNHDSNNSSTKTFTT